MSDTERRLAAALAEHPPTETPLGPLYCAPCSEAIGDWVKWTPEHAAAALLPVVAEIEAEARAGALREAADEMDRHDVVTIEDTDIGSNLIPVSPADRLRRMADEMKEQG